MIKLIVGQKGKGKTKYLLDRVNNAVKTADGNVVYLDKSTKHMFELDRKVRLINVTDFPLGSSDAFVGFVCGIVSQDHDLEQLYLDSFLKIAYIEGKENSDLESVLSKLEKISDKYSIEICISLSVDAKDLPESYKEKVIVAL